MKINGNAIKPGNVIQHDGTLWVAVKTAHVKPGKGGAFAQVELKNLLDGRKLNERFRSSDTVERIRLEQKDYTFLYEQGDMLVFMDIINYDQIELHKDFVGEERVLFLQDGMQVTVEFHEERPIGITLPDTVVLEIIEADAVVKGQTASSSYKPAKASNGMRILIPPYMGTGRAGAGLDRDRREPLHAPRGLGRLSHSLSPCEGDVRRGAQGRARADA